MLLFDVTTFQFGTKITSKIKTLSSSFTFLKDFPVMIKTPTDYSRGQHSAIRSESTVRRLRVLHSTHLSELRYYWMLLVDKQPDWDWVGEELVYRLQTCTCTSADLILVGVRVDGSGRVLGFFLFNSPPPILFDFFVSHVAQRRTSWCHLVQLWKQIHKRGTNAPIWRGNPPSSRRSHPPGQVVAVVEKGKTDSSLWLHPPDGKQMTNCMDLRRAALIGSSRGGYMGTQTSSVFFSTGKRSSGFFSFFLIELLPKKVKGEGEGQSDDYQFEGHSGLSESTVTPRCFSLDLDRHLNLSAQHIHNCCQFHCCCGHWRTQRVLEIPSGQDNYYYYLFFCCWFIFDFMLLNLFNKITNKLKHRDNPPFPLWHLLNSLRKRFPEGLRQEECADGRANC